MNGIAEAFTIPFLAVGVGLERAASVEFDERVDVRIGYRRGDAGG